MNIAFTPVTRLIGLLGSTRIKIFVSSSMQMMKTGAALSTGVLAALSAGACKQQQPTDKPVQYLPSYSVSQAAATDARQILDEAGVYDRTVADQLIIKVESIKVKSVGSGKTNPAVRNDQVSAVKFKRRSGLQQMPASTGLRTAKPRVGSPVTVSM